MRFTECERTELTIDQAAKRLHDALVAESGGGITIDALALALAKCALETGRFRSMYNWNFGNVRPGRGWLGMFTCLPICNEYEADGRLHWYTPEGEVASRLNRDIIGQRYTVPPGHPGSRFRAFAGPTDGAYQYVDFMVRGVKGRFSKAYAWLIRGDGKAMVAEMAARGYFTANAGEYSAAVQSLQREFAAHLRGKPLPEATLDMADHEWERLRAQVVEYHWRNDFVDRDSGAGSDDLEV
jgi:hypothetical protein